MMDLIGQIIEEYGMNDTPIVNSKEELILRTRFKNSNNVLTRIFNKEQNRTLTYEEKAYLVYVIISGIELTKNTEGINWLNYRKQVNNKFYYDYLNLTRGQFKLLVLSIMNNFETDIKLANILNFYQLTYINHILTNEHFQIEECEKLYGFGWQDKYIGRRELETDEHINCFFDGSYTHQNMIDYFILAFTKLYSFKRLNTLEQTTNLRQLQQLIGVISKNGNIRRKFGNFLNALDDEQLIMIGY